MISLTNASLRHGTRLLFDRASFAIHPGQRVGLTGANGTGKTSFLRLLCGDLQLDSGELFLPSGWRIAVVKQETPSSARSALDYTLDGDAELRELQAALEAAVEQEDFERQATLHAQLENVGAYDAESRAATLLSGLGFKAQDIGKSVAEFSGGWRMRLNLAQALMCRSDLLLLDEPTNHLDLDAVIWLESWLRRYPGTLILISHDREFLDTVVDHIAHVERQGLTLTRGNYSQFEAKRAEQLANQQAAYEKQQREITHMQSFVDRFRAKATKAKQAQSRLKALARLEHIAPAHIDSPFRFAFKPTGLVPHQLLALEQAAVGYTDTPLLNNVDFKLNSSDRIGLIGPNGAGKSTFIKLLAGALPTQKGERSTAKDTRIGYFAQHQLDHLRPEDSPIQHLQRLDPKATEQQLRDHLGGFGFQGDRVFEAVAPFSGGEKSRLALAILVYQAPNVLLLDEPTNHLDMEMRLALTLALQSYEGAVVTISHDRHLLRSNCDQLFLVADGVIQPFDGDLDTYPAWLKKHNSQSDSSGEAEKPSTNSAENKREQKRRDAEMRKALAPQRRLVSQLEDKIAKCEKVLAEIESTLADASLYEAERKKDLQKLLAKQTEQKKALAEIEDQWTEASMALEEAENQLRAV